MSLEIVHPFALAGYKILSADSLYGSDYLSVCDSLQSLNP